MFFVYCKNVQIFLLFSSRVIWSKLIFKTTYKTINDTLNIIIQ